MPWYVLVIIRSIIKLCAIYTHVRPFFFISTVLQVDKESAKRLQSVGEAKLRKAYKEIFGERSDTRLEGAVEDYQKELEAHTYPNGGKLRDYQAEGVSWLMSNFVNKRSSVLADEMGKLIISKGTGLALKIVGYST